MREQITLLGPLQAVTDRSSLSALPKDLLEQVRGRVRLLALLLAAGFAVDPLLALVVRILGALAGFPVIFGNLGFIAADAAVAVASLGLWWMAGGTGCRPHACTPSAWSTRWRSASHLAFTVYWQWTLDHGIVPPITWVPRSSSCSRWSCRVRRAGCSRRPSPPALMSPLALLLLTFGARCTPSGDDYIRSFVNSAFAVGFAYLGRASGLSAGSRGRRGARAGELPPGGAPRPRRHGRGLARRPPAAGAPGGDQADPARRRTAAG